MDAAAVRAFLTGLQDALVERLSALDGQAFRRDAWVRAQGGGGISCLIENGALFERGGVNFSHVTGGALPASASANRPEIAGRAFEAMGVSLVLHPRNPFVPTVHMNVRFFVATRADTAPVWWFGGGMDLTPYYGFDDDAVHFHRTCRDALAPFGADRYPRFKQIVDPNDRRPLIQLEHEIRSITHPLYARPHVNRDPVQNNRDYTPGYDARQWALRGF